jgi:YfiH family protein
MALLAILQQLRRGNTRCLHQTSFIKCPMRFTLFRFMNDFIKPDIFNGYVQGFFTEKTLGTDIKKISRMLAIKREDVFLPIQKHTDTVIVVENDMRPKVADAVITRKKGLLIGVQVADCIPVLLFDRKNSIIGAVHAGWRGTALKIVKKTVEKMMEYALTIPEDIFVAMGPCIKMNCYPVDKDVKAAVFNATGEGKYFSKIQDNKFLLDVTGANMIQLLSTGIPEENIWHSEECTHCMPEKYYSYRYSKEYTGSQGGFIGIL